VLRIHNTLSRQLEVFEPLEPGRVRMYVCGMTVYDYSHIGHARAMASFDLVYRWLVELGYAVDYVRNHTDVDDKIIRRANEKGQDALALSRYFIDVLEEDLLALGMVPPTHTPKVSDHIDGIVAMTSTLIEKGHAYAVPVGSGSDVYYAVESFDRYGQLSGKRLDDLRAGERIEVDERKRHPGDFALWKSAKPGEIAWPSPWGPGRPGWHIECSAMATSLLGNGFDIHGGGIDLVFPHHENEIAQSEAATGHHPFARYWMHNGHLTLDTGKMSKSIGNIVRIRDILDEVPAETLRFLYLETSYRSPLPYSSSRLEEALAGLDRIYQAKELVEQMALGTSEPLPEEGAAVVAEAERFPTEFADAMNDDFNSAKALSLIFDLARNVNRYAYGKPKVVKRSAVLAGPVLAAFALAGRVLGIGALASDVWFQEVRQKRLRKMGRSEDEIEARLRDRAAARANKDFPKADAIRKELADLGVVVMDGTAGTTWRMQVAPPEA
jgi:cysteinyl-tRNA synthetase